MYIKGVCSWGHRWLSRSWILSTSCTYFMMPNQTPEDLPSHLQTSFDDTDLTGHDARFFKRAPWHRGKDLHMKYIYVYEHCICETWYKYSYNTSAIARCWKGYEPNRKPEQCVDLFNQLTSGTMVVWNCAGPLRANDHAVMADPFQKLLSWIAHDLPCLH